MGYKTTLLRRKSFHILFYLILLLLFVIYFRDFIKRIGGLSISTQKYNMTVDLKDRPGNQGMYFVSLIKGERSLTRPTRNYSVTVNQLGQLGNQMLQYAALLGIADKLNMTPVIKPGPMLKRVFDVPHVSNITLKNAREFNSRCCSYIPFPVTEVTHNWFLHGYFRSWKYFVNSSQLVRKSLRFKENILASAKQFLQETKMPNSTLVGIHVRRGDFLDTASVQLGRKIAGPEYIRKAQQYFLSKFKNVQFLVVSNDMKWCQQNIQGTNVIQSQYTDPGVDLALLSMCDHVIITVGSFGWWGAWLAGGITVYYKDHLRPETHLYNKSRDADIFPPEWIALS